MNKEWNFPKLSYPKYFSIYVKNFSENSTHVLQAQKTNYCEMRRFGFFNFFIVYHYFVYLSLAVRISYSFNYPKDEHKKWDTLYNIDFRCANHRGPHHSSDLVHNWYTKVYCSVPQNGKLMVKSPTLMFWSLSIFWIIVSTPLSSLVLRGILENRIFLP